MHRFVAAALLSGSALVAAPASAAAIDDFLGDVMMDDPGAAPISERCDAFVAEFETRIDTMESASGAASVEVSLQRYDDIVNLIYAGMGEFALYREVLLTADQREAAGTCEVRLAAAANRISLSRGVYDRLAAIDASGAGAATQHYLAKTLEGYRKSGIDRSPEVRAQVQKLNDELAELGNQFDANIANGRKVVKVQSAMLEGLPQDYIDAHQPGEDGLVEISTDYPDLIPVLSYARSDELRRMLTTANMTRAPENDAILKQILAKRQELAQLLGQPNYATLELQDKMLDRPDKVSGLLEEMASAARPASERDYARKLAVWQQDHPGADSFTYADNSYLTAIVKQRDYDYDAQEARQYFAYDNVRDGVVKLSEDLFDVEIRRWDTPTWHEDVETYEVFDDGRLIGRILLDSHPRPGKYNHGNMIPLRAGIPGRSVPVVALVMNLPKGDHSTGLMEYNDVNTFLHEFGHLLHGIFGAQQWAGISGVSTEWDFVEAPSQMLEEWAFDYDTLASFAVDADGNTIPRELVTKMNKARYFDLGMGDMRQLGLSNISLGLHMGAAPEDLSARVMDLYNVYGPLPLPEGTSFEDAFGHLNGYSTVYYTYRWSKVIADDLFTRFQTEGMRNPETAAAYRALVLAPGGSKPAAELVEDFLGRPISLDAYKAKMAQE